MVREASAYKGGMNMTEKKRKEPTAEQVFASDMWRATDGTGLLVLG